VINPKLARRFSDIIRKNKDEVLAFFSFSLPTFVYRNINYVPEDNIPVFCFHSVEPKLLEEQFKYISENNYKTLNSESLMDIITGKKKPIRNSLALTFDDGRKSLWTTAFPLLKKYNLTAISFIVPSIIKENISKSPSLEDLWSGKILPKDIEDLESEMHYSNWNEITEMHESGLVDFQSHSLNHASVFINNALTDFINPELKPSLLNSTLNPLVSNANDNMYTEYGTPVYKWASNLTADKRYIPDEKLNSACIEYVKSNGGASFFNNSKWRKELGSYFDEMENESGNGVFQNYNERILEIKEDLFESRRIIEKRLNKSVTHLCLPWYMGNELSVTMAKETGYKCIYWGIKDNKSSNFIGDDPYYIKRINDYYLFSLPGKGRLSLRQQLINKVKSLN
jgi:Polysaccharide deacetylase